MSFFSKGWGGYKKPVAKPAPDIDYKYTLPKNNINITLIVNQNDITNEKTDAIVNAANEYLSHGAGVAGAIVSKGGYEIQKASDVYVKHHGIVPTGNAATTSAGRLKCKKVIHAVGPVWFGGKRNEENDLYSAVMNSLKEADNHSLESIAIPAISSGIFGFPKDLCAKIMFNVVEDYCQKSEEGTLRMIKFTNFDYPTSNIFRKEFCKRFTDSDHKPKPYHYYNSQEGKQGEEKKLHKEKKKEADHEEEEEEEKIIDSQSTQDLDDHIQQVKQAQRQKYPDEKIPEKKYMEINVPKQMENNREKESMKNKEGKHSPKTIEKIKKPIEKMIEKQKAENIEENKLLENKDKIISKSTQEKVIHQNIQNIQKPNQDITQEEEKKHSKIQKTEDYEEDKEKTHQNTTDQKNQQTSEPTSHIPTQPHTNSLDSQESSEKPQLDFLKPEEEESSAQNVNEELDDRGMNMGLDNN